MCCMILTKVSLTTLSTQMCVVLALRTISPCYAQELIAAVMTCTLWHHFIKYGGGIWDLRIH